MSTEQRDDGGPAFPCEWDYINSNRAVANGMTLRDYFAAKAMAAYMTSQQSDFSSLDELGRWSFMVADAMLKARQS